METNLAEMECENMPWFLSFYGIMPCVTDAIFNTTNYFYTFFAIQRKLRKHSINTDKINVKHLNKQKRGKKNKEKAKERNNCCRTNVIVGISIFLLSQDSVFMGPFWKWIPSTGFHLYPKVFL